MINHRKSLSERRASAVSKTLNGRVSYSTNLDGSHEVYVPAHKAVVVIRASASVIFAEGFEAQSAMDCFWVRAARNADQSVMPMPDGSLDVVLGKALAAIAKVPH